MEIASNSDGPRPRVGPGGLVTLAYLKARLDAGEDQLGIFMPLIVDVLPDLPNRNFTVAEVQEAVEQKHGVAMPQGTVATLLGRASRQRLLVRDAGRFHVQPGSNISSHRVSDEKAKVAAAQLRLGESFGQHATRRKIHVGTAQDSLDLILRFLEGQQIAVILGSPLDDQLPNLSPLECGVVVEYLHDIVANDPALSSVLAAILEGLVLYHAAFLPDLNEASRRFDDLTVVFDSVLVRQALGYEGPAARELVRETMGLLSRTGARCVVFETTVQEIHRILWMYQDKLATATGRREIRPSDMARYFLTQRYKPSDAQEMSALLESEISSAGFETMRIPRHIDASTYSEEALAAKLADPRTGDLNEPRVQHDVDCVAGVLTLRRGHHSNRVEDSRAVFATLAGRVIENTQTWWFEHERESGIPPIVHFRALANLAWLKKPATSPGLPLRDLVALCTAAMRPTAKTWQRFIKHLERLKASDRLSDDQVSAIIVSAVSDRLLHDAELQGEDPNDVDAATLDEVVDRVVAKYSEEAADRATQISSTYETLLIKSEASAAVRVAEAESATTAATERLRRRDLSNQGRSRKWARVVSGTAFWSVVSIVGAGCALTVVRSLLDETWLGVVGGLALALVALLETAGILGHLRAKRRALDSWLEDRLYRWLSGEAPSQSDPTRSH